uniref:EOG090X0B12 n=1 Tax=Lynceus sp. MCZ IZ 141354 TaxID=1930659 RepID=A0A9N6WUS8_9CRUS|nr:EOG090X0B12 [Lynceus sp. MCZ IZ 141354]
MIVVGRIEGLISSTDLIGRITNIVSDNEAYLIAARADREERNFNQVLRQQQDEAYQESLLADREKEAKKREERAQKEREEQELLAIEEEEKRAKEALLQKKVQAADYVPEEPPNDHKDAVRLLIRLPSGKRLERRFLRTQHTLCDLYHFVLADPDAPCQFDIATSFPRRTLPVENSKMSLAEAGLQQSEVLLVTDLDA